MTTVKSLDSFAVPLGGQGIELQEIVYVEGGMALLRVRIREGKRFTVFDIDPATARRWGEAMERWASRQPGGGRPWAPQPARTWSNSRSR
jgi:hypothetical protein